MKTILLLLASCALARAATTSEGRDESHCTARFQDNNVCACSNQLDGIHCGNDSLRIGQCYCMYYDSVSNSTLVAKCYYACYIFLDFYMRVTTSTKFNIKMCGRYGINHTGYFYSMCKDGQGLAAYSYRLLECAPCSNHGYKNWFKYFAITLLPLTVFYIAALLLGFNVTSSRFSGIIMVLQIITSPLQVEFVLPKTS